MHASINTVKHKCFRDQREIKFDQKQHWCRGNATLGFGADQIRTQVFMATDSCYRVTMGKTASLRFPRYFDRIIFILTDNDDIHKSLEEFEMCPDTTTNYGGSCP